MIEENIKRRTVGTLRRKRQSNPTRKIKKKHRYTGEKEKSSVEPTSVETAEAMTNTLWVGNWELKTSNSTLETGFINLMSFSISTS